MLGLCAHAGPECLISAALCLLLLLLLLVTLCVAATCVTRQRKQVGWLSVAELLWLIMCSVQGQERRIRSASINPGDRYRQSVAGKLDS